MAETGAISVAACERKKRANAALTNQHGHVHLPSSGPIRQILPLHVYGVSPPPRDPARTLGSARDAHAMSIPYFG